MIHGFMRAGQTEEARRMFHSLQDSGHDAYSGWLAITNQLFAAGQQAAARELVESRQPQWLPDADLYEEIIKSVCSNNEGKPFAYTLNTSQSASELANGDAQVEEALQVLLEMQVQCSLLLWPLYCCCCKILRVLCLLPYNGWNCQPQLDLCISWLCLLACQELRQRL